MNDVVNPVVSRPRWQLMLAGHLPLEEKEKNAIRSNIARWISDGTWELWEGCDLIYGKWPDLEGRFLVPIRSLRATNLLDRAQRDVQVNKLWVGNFQDRKQKWWTTPAEFLKWAAARPRFIGADRAALLKEFIPVAVEAKGSDPNRVKVLESTAYLCTEFDMACAAIAHLWLNAKEGDGVDRGFKTVEKWLVATYGTGEPKKLPDAQVERIDSLIRPDWAKRIPQKGSPKKPK